MISVGETVPRWSATAHVRGKEVELSEADYRDHWHVLYWYPMDFTFVCPTEVRGFQELLGRFRNANVEVIGASTDSFYSHKTWFADRKIFPHDVTHPILADTSHRVSRAFGVLDDGTGVAYRATVIVDDVGRIRSVSMNDVGVGRSPAEVLRTVQALQSGGLCAADWHPGDAFVG